MKLNPVQAVAYGAYPTDMLPIPDLSGTFPKSPNPFDPRNCGDHLFSFIMYELDDVGSSPDEALKRITTARLQLEEVERALFHAKELWK